MKVDEFVLHATKASGQIQNRIAGSHPVAVESVMENLHGRRAYAIRERGSGVEEFEIEAIGVDSEGLGGGLRIELKRVWTTDSKILLVIRTVSIVGAIVVAAVFGASL